MNIPTELLDSDLLFHYSKPYVAMEKILYKGEIRFSSFSNMNDPYEYKIPVLGVSGYGPIPPSTASNLTAKLRNTILYKSKILSIVRTKELDLSDDYQLVFTKPRLWAQYAEAQYGVCLIFSLKAFIVKFESTYPKLTVYHDYVEYNLQKGKKSVKNHLGYGKSQSLDENIRNHIDAHKKDIFFRKYEDFRDENEYRIVLINWADNTNSDIYIDLHGIIRGVILGERFHHAYEETIKHLVYNLKVPLYRIGYGRKVHIKKHEFTPNH